jgi:hypothetical protein
MCFNAAPTTYTYACIFQVKRFPMNICSFHIDHLTLSFNVCLFTYSVIIMATILWCPDTTYSYAYPFFVLVLTSVTHWQFCCFMPNFPPMPLYPFIWGCTLPYYFWESVICRSFYMSIPAYRTSFFSVISIVCGLPYTHYFSYSSFLDCLS